MYIRQTPSSLVRGKGARRTIFILILPTAQAPFTERLLPKNNGATHFKSGVYPATIKWVRFIYLTPIFLISKLSFNKFLADINKLI